MGEQLQDRILFDTRLVKLNLERGKLERAELDKHLKQLPDVTDKSQPVFQDGEDPDGTD